MGIMKPGDEVIVPANTYIASILAISENGLKPVLVEPDITTYQIDENKIEAAITERTKAILIVHLYGQCAYTEKIGDLCKRYNLKIMHKLMDVSTMVERLVHLEMRQVIAFIRERI